LKLIRHYYPNSFKMRKNLIVTAQMSSEMTSLQITKELLNVFKISQYLPNKVINFHDISLNKTNFEILHFEMIIFLSRCQKNKSNDGIKLLISHIKLRLMIILYKKMKLNLHSLQFIVKSICILF
jgi:hypothetical protein